ncbi:hypothetical protein DFH28DRAFT_883981 [Melampsora americana]|nr:hypothetical protein DFH28DRAFT_883981 [Melampsora americana]
MIINSRKLKVTRMKYSFGPRGGLQSRHQHTVVHVKKKKQLIPIQGSHVVYGFGGFLALLHYAARFPFCGSSVKKLIIEDVSKKRSSDILAYFSNRTCGTFTLSQVIELRLKCNGKGCAVVHRFKDLSRQNPISLDLNNLHRERGSMNVGRNVRRRSVTISCMREFIQMVEVGSQLPYTMENVNRIWTRDMDIDEVDEIVNFFTELEAGIQTFPIMAHLVDTNEMDLGLN